MCVFACSIINFCVCVCVCGSIYVNSIQYIGYKCVCEEKHTISTVYWQENPADDPGFVCLPESSAVCTEVCQSCRGLGSLAIGWPARARPNLG